MKKKLITGILATLACAACFAACGQTNDSGSSSASGLTDAKAYLNDMYKSKDVETREDYTVVNSLAFDGATYTIEWSVDVTEGVTVVPGDKTVTIDVDEEATADIAYVLTATIKDAAGNTETLTFNRTVLKAPSVVPSAITAAPVEGTAYKLYMRQVTKKTDLYFTGKMSGFYLATTNASNGETYENGIDVYAEAVDGKAGSFYLTFTTFTDNDEPVKQYIGVKNTYNNGSWHDNAILSETTTVASDETATYEFTYSETYGTMVATLAGVKAGAEENTTEIKTVTYFLGTNGTYYTFGAMDVADITDKDACVGKLVTMVDKSAITDEVKVEFEKAALEVVTAYNAAGEATLPTAGTTYTDVAIAWSVETNAAVTLAENVLTISEVTAETTVVLTATLTLGEEEVTQTFTLTLTPPVADPTVIVDAAYALEKGESLEGTQTLTGIITKVNSEYSEKYGNITVTIAVAGRADKPIECYRLTGTGADTIAAGDTITVSGIIKNYNGTIEFDQGCTIDAVQTAASIVDAAYALEKGTSMEGTQMLTGVITNVKTAYNAEYQNVTVIIQVGDKEDKLITCFRMKGTGADVIKAGDTVTVSGIIKNYNGTIEFDAGCILESYEVAPEAAPDITNATTLATFEFGANDTDGETAHADGNDLGETASYTEGSYTLALSAMSKVYGPAFDATGKSCIKLGTSSKVGTFTFTVGADVDVVVLKVAGYKANKGALDFGGATYNVDTVSNDGAYTEIVIDTRTTKTVTVSTSSNAYRAMVNSIAYLALAK